MGVSLGAVTSALVIYAQLQGTGDAALSCAGENHERMRQSP